MNRQPTILVDRGLVPEDLTGIFETKLIHQPTERNPAIIVVTFTNTAINTRRYTFGFTPPFSNYTADHELSKDKLIAVPLTKPFMQHIPDSPIDECWESIDEPGILESGTIVELESNEQVSRKYALLSHPDNRHCFPQGTYQFEDVIGIPGDKASNTNYQWSFSVSVK